MQPNGTEKCEFQQKGFWLCLYALIENQCNCTPTANPLMSPPPSVGLPECNTNIYNVCGFINQSIVPMPPECKSTYPAPCENWSFLSTVISLTENEPKTTNKGIFDVTVVRISVKDFSYLEIAEQRVFTLQQFLAAFGGMLGIWLGLSFFSLVRIIAIPTEIIISLLMRRFNEKFSTIIDLQKNPKLRNTVSSRPFLTLEYIFDFKYDELIGGIKLPAILVHAVMAIFILPGLYETGFMCIDLYNRYSNGETTSSVQFLNNKTFAFPASTLCLPINIGEFEFIETEQKHFHHEPVNVMFNITSKESLLDGNWSYSLLQLAVQHQALYGQIERIGDFYTFLQKSTVNDRNVSCGLEINNFDRYIRSIGVTIEELKQKCGIEVKKLITIDIKHLNETKGNQISGPMDLVNETRFISETTICYWLQLDEHIFTTKTEGILLNVNRELLPDSEKNCTFTIDLSGQDSNLNQGDFRAQEDGSILSIQFEQMSTFQIKIREIFITLSPSINNCSQEKTQADCKDDCRIEMIQKYCNCTPVSWSRLNSTNKEYCTLDKYFSCFQYSGSGEPNNLDFQKDLASCSGGCLPSCTRIRYQQYYPFRAHSTGPNIAKTTIQIQQFSYFAYLEDYSYTFSTYISEFGGDIGLWVGLYFLIFVEIFYVALCVLSRLLMVLIKMAPIPSHEETQLVSLVQDLEASRAAIPAIEEPKTNRVLRLLSLD
jgi:hypothetical protein